jgi:hypothetical protein
MCFMAVAKNRNVKNNADNQVVGLSALWTFSGESIGLPSHPIKMMINYTTSS